MAIVGTILGAVLILEALFGRGEFKAGTFRRHSVVPAKYGLPITLGIGAGMMLMSLAQLSKGLKSSVFTKVGGTGLAITAFAMGVGMIAGHLRHYRSRLEPAMSRAQAMVGCVMGALFVVGGLLVAIFLWTSGFVVNP